MTSKVWLCFLASVVAVCGQGKGGKQGFPQPQGAREVTVTPIPRVVAAGSKWTLAWQGSDNADGIVGHPDGGVLFAQEQPNQIRKLDTNDHVVIFARDTGGAGALAIDSRGSLLAVQRTCTDPGRKPAGCTEPTAVAELVPDRKVLANSINGKGLGRLNDLVVSKTGGIYFNGDGTYYLDPSGKVTSFGAGLRTNGIMLNRDEDALYVTNGQTIVAFDIMPDGSVTNQRSFGKLEGGGPGDGMALDGSGRLYVSTPPGIQVLSREGKYLGLIPTPRSAISVAFSGSGKRTLYVVCSGAVGPDGKEFTTPEGVRNNAKTIYKIQMLAEGFQGRAK